MQIALQQLPAQLQRGLKNLYLLHGDETLLVQQAADRIRTAARAGGHTERQVFTVQGAHFKWAQVLQAGQAMSLFADKQLVDLRIPSGKPGKEGSVALQELAEAARHNSDVLWLITLPKLDFASLKTAWFTALEGAGSSVKVDLIERRALPAWIAEQIKSVGLALEPGEAGNLALQWFADRVEGNLLAAHQEVQKLALLHPAGHALSAADIEASVAQVARFDVFKLTENMLMGNLRRVQRMLDGLQAEGVAEVLVHFCLSEEVRNLRAVKAAVASGKALGMALREQRVWGNKEALYERAVPRLSSGFLDAQLANVQVLDGIVKGLKQANWPSEPWAALRHTAMALTLACAAKESR